MIKRMRRIIKNIVYDLKKLNMHLHADLERVIAEDISHSLKEKRFYCFGKVENGIMTVRFTYRKNIIRIIGAGYWRKGRKVYENKNKS